MTRARLLLSAVPGAHSPTGGLTWSVGAGCCYKCRLFFVPGTKCLFADLRIFWKYSVWSFVDVAASFLSAREVFPSKQAQAVAV